MARIMLLQNISKNKFYGMHLFESSTTKNNKDLDKSIPDSVLIGLTHHNIWLFNKKKEQK